MALLAICYVLTTSVNTSQEVQSYEREVLLAMESATNFMMTSVSNQGGFLWKYSADLSEQWGEIPALKSQVWVQPPGTASVGNMLIQAYKVSGDEIYLKYAEEVASAIIWGQHQSGGWNYLIDFDSAGLQEWYEKEASKCWGWEEYYHYYGNATFDDGVTVSASRFLLNMYLSTGSQKYQEPLKRALDFILISQYPNGGWPQRFPHSMKGGDEDNHDYTPYYTFNDDVIHGNIIFLLEVHDKLGGEEYLAAAHNGMNFYLLSQIAPPQAGWALQYDLQMKPGLARSYEPASVASGQTVRNINDLETFYKMTGDAKYLQPIPNAIQWLENSAINSDPSKNFTHATFYEMVTNKPLYAHREGSSIDDGRYWVDYEQSNFPGHYGMLRKVDVTAIKKEYDRVRSLPVREAHTEYLEDKMNELVIEKVDVEEIKNIISTLDSRGAWLQDLSIPYYPDVVGQPRRIVKGISTQTYISNMRKLMSFLSRD